MEADAGTRVRGFITAYVWMSTKELPASNPKIVHKNINDKYRRLDQHCIVHGLKLPVVLHQVPVNS